ncbi:geranylgeranylglyceryl/heptaprenylglyceryl phosphate synthase [Candidatus Micrarchaeota archaeon]|nr:geranylgeranylglyceryl/heptaprenylglyceryl phosphate synthase [Candidatus Micrarchaeota archaeon]
MSSIGKVEKYYKEKIESQGAMLFSLIDPDKFSLEKGKAIAKSSYENGADVILVGGTIGAQGKILDETVQMIKEGCGGIPVVLYPGNISGISEYADAIYFMHMLNSRDIYWLSTAQIQAAPVIAKMHLEAIPTTYLIIEPGRAVGWVGNANVVPRERSDLAAACALAAKYTGSHVLITDAGSGAPLPTPPDMISAIAKMVGNNLFYFNAGGVRTPVQAAECIAAGAHGIHVGNAFEEQVEAKKIKEISAAVRKEGKKRV